MDETHDPIPFYDPQSTTLFGHVHYGNSRLTEQLRILPGIQAVVLGIFVLLGYIGYRGMKEGEQRSIWIGILPGCRYCTNTATSSSDSAIA